MQPGTDVVDDDRGTRGGQCKAVGTAKAASPAGHDGDLSFEHAHGSRTPHRVERKTLAAADGGSCFRTYQATAQTSITSTYISEWISARRRLPGESRRVFGLRGGAAEAQRPLPRTKRDRRSQVNRSVFNSPEPG